MPRAALPWLGVLCASFLATPAWADDDEEQPTDDEDAWVIGAEADPPSAEAAPCDGSCAETEAQPAPPVEKTTPAKTEPKHDDRPFTLTPVPGSAPPPGYVDSYQTGNLLIAGATTTVISYLLTVAGTKILADQSSHEDVFGVSLVPLVGPFAASALDSIDDPSRAFLIGLGLAQCTGFTLTLAGSLQKKHVWERKDTPAPVALSVSVSPTGATLLGSF